MANGDLPLCLPLVNGLTRGSAELSVCGGREAGESPFGRQFQLRVR